jgi:hypothetical protein
MLMVIMISSREKPLVLVDAISSRLGRSCSGMCRISNSQLLNHSLTHFAKQNSSRTQATGEARTRWGAGILHRREGRRQRQSTTVQRASIGLL